MGRRNAIRWSEGNEVDLLANLDFVIQKILTETGRYGSTEDVRRNIQSELPGPRRTQDQIDRRLRKFWKDHNVNPEPWYTYESIYRYGTSILVTLASDLRDKVKEELEILKDNQKLKVVGTPRKTRSESRNLVAESSGAKGVEVASSEHTPTRSQRKRLYQSPRHSASKRIKQESVPSKNFSRRLAPFARLWIEERFQQTARTTRSIPRISESTLSGPPSVTTLPDDDDCRDPALERFKDSETPSQSFLFTDKFKGTPVFDYGGTNSTKRIFNTQISTQGESDGTLLDLFNDIEYFRGELSRLEKVRRHTVENERLRQGIQTKSLQGIVEERNKTISELKQQLKDQAFAQRLLGKGSGKQVLPSRDKIKSSHEDMRKNILGLSVVDNIYYTEDEVRCVNSKELDALRDRVLDDIAQPPLSDNESHSLDVWVQSLTGAAICEWVFKESYQCIAMMNTPLLDAYRRSLRTLCNDEILQIVDSVAHQIVVDSHHYKGVFLPRIARRLARRLLNALAPLVKGKYTVGEKDFEEDLEAIFHSALEIKTLGMTGNHVFEFIWPSRSTAFDNDSMTEESSRGRTDDREISEKKTKKVLLTLVPGLRVYSYERQLVDYCNFTSGDEKDLGKADLIAHTLVMTE